MRTQLVFELLHAGIRQAQPVPAQTFDIELEAGQGALAFLGAFIAQACRWPGTGTRMAGIAIGHRDHQQIGFTSSHHRQQAAATEHFIVGVRRYHHQAVALGHQFLQGNGGHLLQQWRRLPLAQGRARALQVIGLVRVHSCQPPAGVAA
ncbi:hypothetical protein D3C86_1638010 [compost metagenome]